MSRKNAKMGIRERNCKNQMVNIYKNIEAVQDFRGTP